MKNIVGLAPWQVALMRVITRLWLSVLRMIPCFMSTTFTLNKWRLEQLFVGKISHTLHIITAKVTGQQTKLWSSSICFDIRKQVCDMVKNRFQKSWKIFLSWLFHHSQYFKVEPRRFKGKVASVQEWHWFFHCEGDMSSVLNYNYTCVSAAEWHVIPSTREVSRVTLAAFRLPAGRLSPILSSFSLSERPPFLDLALRKESSQQWVKDTRKVSVQNRRRQR